MTFPMLMPLFDPAVIRFAASKAFFPRVSWQGLHGWQVWGGVGRLRAHHQLLHPAAGAGGRRFAPLEPQFGLTVDLNPKLVVSKGNP